MPIVLTIALVAAVSALWGDNTFNKDLLARANEGDMEAQFDLALCYQTGEGVGKDMGEAAKWYRRAAEQGHMEARFVLAKVFDEEVI